MENVRQVEESGDRGIFITEDTGMLACRLVLITLFQFTTRILDGAINNTVAASYRLAFVQQPVWREQDGGERLRKNQRRAVNS